MAQTVNHSPGSIVSCRSRQWVVLPSENQDVIRLRPLSGNEDEIAGIYHCAFADFEAVKGINCFIGKG
ncbi:MAG: hypothetical protein V7K32_02125 [Nostoc sp.]|uniref:hypothetical protein n=1 Tax=Nostoc sp. TaxID=1180 RepID=UPI002FFC9C6B